MPINSGDFESNYKVRLVSVLDPNLRVVFDASPILTEEADADYTPLEPVHMPGGIYAYRKSSSRTFNIDVPLISRTRNQATENMKRLQILRSWLKPYFGKSSSERSSVLNVVSNQSNNSMSMKGAPPDILYLYAYSSDNHSSRQNQYVNLNKIPVVMTRLSDTYPNDVGYIASADNGNEPFPVKMEISLSLKEVHSPREYENFDLVAFRNGKLVGF